MSKKEELVAFIKNLSEEDVKKIVEHLPLLEQLVKMDNNELTYSETLLTKLFSTIFFLVVPCFLPPMQ